MRRGPSQITTRVEVKKLIDHLLANREQHRAVYLEAYERYRQAAMNDFTAQLDAAQTGKPFKINLGLVIPQDHTDDYTRVIQMLEWTEDNTIELDQDDFAQYVQDEWDWSQQWATANASYGL